ncbi:bifunctional alpha,alpha-trehalose-phosphate synthase (UDP-forming)/trehalose-phosphatase [Candidatus Parcubacteria bacterium]|nr:bifunctional alpha,alpha-trehalose-phosphate synthase (UDP-forming)/trehalose-phosphatase [Candidatus Parcubacteria bacterium]
MAEKKLLIVSNRLPVRVSKKGDKLQFTLSSGGLATAMSSLPTNHSNRLWIGWPGIATDDLSAAEKAQITKKLKELDCFPVFLSKKQIEKYYDGYCNETIWPLFHYFQSQVKHHTTYWSGYKEVNDIFKKVVLKNSDKDSMVWIHDYQLMLLPRLLRSSLPDSRIGFFLHTPFPSYEIYRLLPQRAEILQGLLGADLIGFQVYDYARHFLSSTLRILGVENKHGLINIGRRIVKVDAFPIGIDYKKFAKVTEDEKTKKQIMSLEKYHDGKKIILSMDRLDYSKGIFQRLEAFELFLKDNPDWIKKIVLVVVAVPSRTEVQTYKDLRNEIEKKISRINGRYGTVDWSPISYQFKNLPFEEVAALFWVSDVALLTPLRDGMNLVAKEYVATKQHKPGVLILSEMAGAVDELPEAIRINPNDISQIVNAIETALNMPEKTQIQKIKSMQRRISKYTVARWSEDFAEQLEESKSWQHRGGEKMLNKEAEQKLLQAYGKSKKRLLLLDYDGSLRNIVSSYDSKRANPTKALKDLIKNLAAINNNEVCIVSGRPRGVLESWFGDLDVSLAAEHGGWIKSENEWSRPDISLNGLRENIINILKRYLDRTPGARIEEKEFAIVWHYRNVLVELAHARNAGIEYELNQLLANTEFGIYSGRKIIEIKPKSINKGFVAEDMFAIHKPDFVLCIGDDYTDEDMFRSLPEDSFTIKIGLEETEARYQISGVSDVLQLLRKLSAN